MSKITKPDRSSLGLIAIALTALLWAVAANVAYSLFVVGVRPLELAGASALVATFGLTILLDSFLGRTDARGMSLHEFGLGLILVGLVGADYVAIQRLPVAIAIVLLFTAPILVVLWNALISRSMPSGAISLALVVSIVGVVLISNLLTNHSSIDGLGILIGLTTAVFFAAFIVLSEKLSIQEPIGVIFKAFAVASLFWIAYQMTQGIPWNLFTLQNLPKVIFVGIVGNLMPYLGFFWCLKVVPIEQAAIAATIEPAIASVVAWVWFGQTLSVMQLVGGFLIVGAITWMQLKSKTSAF